MPVTFRVDDVKVAKDPLPDGLLSTRLGTHRACSRPDLRTVTAGENHPLVDAVHLAFAQHRPLVLTPDVIWTAVAQGFALHVNLNAERLRERFVRHEGKLTLIVDRDGSPITAQEWPAIVKAFGLQIATHVGAGLHKLLLNDFSTTGPDERAASEIVLMDSFQRYFDYELRCICGIPEITLLGTPEDWRAIRRRLDVLGEWDLAWWTNALAPAIDRIVASAEGNFDRDFWQCLYKPQEAYGGDAFTGWLNLLFPYFDTDAGFFRREFPANTGPRASWIFDGGRAESLPKGKSRAPLRVTHADGKSDEWLELIGGFVGVSQDPHTMALKPELGWFVRDAAQEAVLFALRAKSGGEKLVLSDRLPEMFPGELRRVYDALTHASLFDGAWRLRPYDRMSLIDLKGGYAYAFADLSDGRMLAYVHGRGQWPIAVGRESLDATSTIAAPSPLALFEQGLAHGPWFFDRPDFRHTTLKPFLR